MKTGISRVTVDTVLKVRAPTVPSGAFCFGHQPVEEYPDREEEKHGGEVEQFEGQGTPTPFRGHVGRQRIQQGTLAIGVSHELTKKQ